MATRVRAMPRRRAAAMPQARRLDPFSPRASGVWATSWSAIRASSSPQRPILPWMSLSPDRRRAGVRPGSGPTARDVAKRLGSSTVARKAAAVVGRGRARPSAGGMSRPPGRDRRDPARQAASCARILHSTARGDATTVVTAASSPAGAEPAPRTAPGRAAELQAGLARNALGPRSRRSASRRAGSAARPAASAAGGPGATPGAPPEPARRHDPRQRAQASFPSLLFGGVRPAAFAVRVTMQTADHSASRNPSCSHAAGGPASGPTLSGGMASASSASANASRSPGARNSFRSDRVSRSRPVGGGRCGVGSAHSAAATPLSQGRRAARRVVGVHVAAPGRLRQPTGLRRRPTAQPVSRPLRGSIRRRAARGDAGADG